MKRARWFLVVGALALVGSVLGAGISALRARSETVALPPPLRIISTGEGGEAFEHWRAAGFVPLEPPIPLPGDAAGRLSAAVWVRLPEGARIDVVEGSWRWPIGADLDRIEWLMEGGAPRIADVRGTEITPGERFHAYRPLGPSAGQPLVGASFSRGDEPARQAVVLAFASLARDGGVFLRGERGSDPLHRAASIARLALTHDCVSCHAHDQPEAAAESDRWLRRATDASGFYVPAYVMENDAPMERYRPVDRSVESRFIEARCADGPLERSGSNTDLRCADGSMPRLQLDLDAALAAGDAHARRVCEGREWLYDHMTQRARSRYRASVAACEASR